jgi:cellulose biosynthesis protein BcsQ
VPAPPTGGELWPWQEPWEGTEVLEPWEEIPVRASLADRADADLQGSWRITVTSAFPYSGGTTLTGMVGLTLAGMRAEPVLAVDLQPGPDADTDAGMDGGGGRSAGDIRGDGLAARVGSSGPATIADVARHGEHGGAPAELRTMINSRGGGVFDLDVLPLRRTAGGPGTGAVVPADDTVTSTALRTVLGLLAHAYPLVLIDAPAEAPLSPAAVRAADVVVIVTLAAPADLDATLAALRDPDGLLPPRDGAGPRSPVLIAVVSPRRGRWSPRTRSAASRLARRADGLVRIPYDPRLDPSRNTPVRIPRLRRRTRRSYLRLAAVIVDTLGALAAAETEASQTPAGGPLGIPKHGTQPGVSFDDLRSAKAPACIAGPDRPGGPPPAGKEPR